jgi:23S rRNA (cytidine1920-2'-O)/16S rRNA (cytidine1409-2'-O)-methyltransferase
MRGDVLVGDVPCEKAGTMLSPEVDIRLRRAAAPYVGRGGEKLAGVLETLRLDLSNRVAVDVGASTGGFTDCLLQNGVAKVYAVDVGSNQLHMKLRDDPRVVVWEKTHILHLEKEAFAETPSLAVVDVSFIGLRRILEKVAELLSEEGDIVALVKPQFELGPELVSKGGIVKNEADQLRAVELVSEYAQRIGLETVGHYASCLKGGKKGNQEYFIHLRNKDVS